MDQQPININLRSNQPRSKFSGMRSSLSNNFSQTSASQSIQPNREKSEKKNSRLIIKILDKIIGLSIFMLFFGIPLFFTSLSAQGIVFEKQMYFYFWILLGIVTWVTKGVIVGEIKIKRTPLDFPLLGLWLAYILATAFSVNRWRSFWGGFGDPSLGLMSITAYLATYYFILSNFNAKRLKLIFTAIISSGAILSIWTALAILGVKFLPNHLAQYAPLSLTGSITSLGVIFSVLILIITTATLKVAESEKLGVLWKRILISLMLLLLALDFFLILALYNYVPWLGFFIGIVVFLVFILAKLMRPKATWVWLPMIVFMIAMIIRMVGAVPISKKALPAEISLNYKTSNEIAWKSFKHKFILGSGPATYGYDFSLFKPKDFNLNTFYNLRFFQGTGILEEAIPTLGAVGVFFLLVVVLTYIGSQFYFLYKNKEKNKLYSLGTFSAATVLLADIIGTRAGGLVLLLTVLFTTLALASALWESDQKNNFDLSLKASPKFALSLAFIFMVVSAGVAFLFVYIGKVYAADIYAGRAARSINKSPDKAINYLSRAISLNKQEPNYYIQLSRYYTVLANQETAKSQKTRDVNKIQRYLNNSIAIALQAKNMAKNDVNIVESVALIYENSGLYVPDALNLAEKNYLAAQKLEPHNPLYDLKLGQIKLAMAQNKNGKKDVKSKEQLLNDAKNLFQKAIDEKKNYADSYYQLALVDESLKQLDQAIDNGTKAVRINPRNINYLLSLGQMYQRRNKNDDLKIAEQYFKQVIALNDKNVNGHFYLGLLYEKNNQLDQAKTEYHKVIKLLEPNQNNQKVISKIKQMISNLDRGIKNTPESLGLVKNVKNKSLNSPSTQTPGKSQPMAQPTNSDTSNAKPTADTNTTSAPNTDKATPTNKNK